MPSRGGVASEGQKIKMTKKVLNMKDAATPSEEGKKE
jgi:hypothetical protein